MKSESTNTKSYERNVLTHLAKNHGVAPPVEIFDSISIQNP
jgi:hypothetical protein